MVFIVGHPDSSANLTKLDEYYSKLQIEPSKPYLEIARELSIWKNKRLFEHPLERGDISGAVTEANAFHLPRLNELIMHASELQSPFFNETYPHFMNYGALGSVIGHEMTHGFDNNGRKYDWDGSINNWWEAETLKRFDEKGQCLVEQYSALLVPGTNDTYYKAGQTLGEDIADLAGLKQTLRAYKKLVKERGAERRLPGLEGFSTEQLFFIAYGQGWCQSETLARRLSLHAQDVHSLHRFRVNEVLKNTEEFAKAFYCPKGLPMNPKKRCSVW